MAETVLIVGGGLAGLSAAETLRTEGFDGRIVLAGEEPHLPYDRPPLSKAVLTGAQPAADAQLHDAAWYEERAVEVITGARVQQLDRRERVVLAGGSLLGFTVALLATGAAPRALDVPGATLPGIHLLRTRDDAQALATALAARPRVVVVGGGFIGCEVAASARSAGCDVTIVEIFGTLLEKVLGEQVGAAIGSLHTANGVRVHLRTTVTAFEGDGRVERVVLSSGDRLEADLVVVGIGVTPNDELAREAAIGCNDGIVVDELCRTGAPGIYAAGDCARRADPITGQRIRVEHWDNAIAQGAAAGRAMLGRKEPFRHVPWFWSDQYDRTIQMSGYASEWDRIVTRGDLAAGDGLAWYLQGPRLRAVVGIGRARDVRAARALIEHGVTPTDAEMADDGFDVRAAAKAARDRADGQPPGTGRV